MQESIKCPYCDGEATLVKVELVTLRSYLCQNCGRTVETIAHFIDVPLPSKTKNYRAMVNSANQIEVRRAAIKIRKIFPGKTNFSLSNLHKQLSAGLLTLDLGVYADSEIDELAAKANELTLNLEFVLIIEKA